MNYIPIIIESRMKVDVETIQHKEYIDFCLNTNPTLIYQLLLDVVEMDNEDLIDYKTILQEYSQRVYKIIPVYEVINEIGPDHKKSFEISVRVKENEILGVGIGKNKKQAEQLAAKKACKILEIKLNEAL